jgi:hypothetical protein
MEVPLALDGLVTDGLVEVVGCFWPQVMTWAREQILPWIERKVPDLASSVRLAFQDLDWAADDLRQVVQVAWRRLRTVLIIQTAQFIRVPCGHWVVRFISCVHDPRWHGEFAVYVVSEHELDWTSQSEQIRAVALANGFSGTWVDIMRARDRLLAAA